MRFKFGRFVWEVGLHPLVVRPTEPSAKDPGPTVASILDKLHHSPVSAVARYFLFDASRPIAESVPSG